MKRNCKKIVFIFLTIFSACQQKDKLESSDDSLEIKTSELAFLMRRMDAHLGGLKQNNLKGIRTENFPIDFNLIHSALPTDSTIKGKFFTDQSDEFLKTVKLLYNDSLKDKKTAYQMVINSCISCHEKMCPGPLRRIKKLNIQ